MKSVTHLFALGLIALGGLAFGDGDPLKVKPVAVMQGADTLISHPMVRMLRTKQQWAELWAMHKGGVIAKPSTDPKAPVVDEKGVPVIDFDKNQVLVVFGGKLVNVQAYDYVKTVDDHGTAIVQLAPNNVPAGPNDAVMLPYILLVLPQEPVPIQVDLDTVGKDGQHFWNKIAAFRAPPAKKGS